MPKLLESTCISYWSEKWKHIFNQGTGGSGSEFSESAFCNNGFLCHKGIFKFYLQTLSSKFQNCPQLLLLYCILFFWPLNLSWSLWNSKDWTVKLIMTIPDIEKPYMNITIGGLVKNYILNIKCCRWSDQRKKE